MIRRMGSIDINAYLLTSDIEPIAKLNETVTPAKAGGQKTLKKSARHTDWRDFRRNDVEGLL